MEVLGDGGGAGVDLHQRDLIFSCHQDALLVEEHSSQVHAPEITMRKNPQRLIYSRTTLCKVNQLHLSDAVAPFM